MSSAARRQPTGPIIRTCGGCGERFQAVKKSQRFCGSACSSRVLGGRSHNWTNDKARSASSRGYGYAHRKARLAAAKRHLETDPCVRCQQPLGPMGPHLHLDHTDDRSGYAGFAHARCNRVAGAKAGRRKQEAGPVTTLRW